MPRVKRGPHRKDKRKKVLKLAKGYYGKKRNAYRIAQQAVDRALKFAYRDRRQKKRDFRSLWIVRINAASRENGLSYNRLISGLRQAGLELNRKVLADIAVHDAEGFAAIVEVAKDALGEEAGLKVRPATEKAKRPERVRTTAAPAKPRPKKMEKAEPEAEMGEPAAAKPKKAKPAKAPAEKAAPEKPAEAEAKPAAKAPPETEKTAAKAEPAETPAKAAPAKAAAKPAKKPAEAAPVETPAKKDLEAMTVAELQELAAGHGIAESDVEGSGASGGAVKADWVRVAGGLEGLTVSELEKLAEKRGIARADVEGSGAGGNVVKADWIQALSKE